MNAYPQTATNADATPKWQQWRGTGRILVVDDDDAVRVVISKAVSRLGFDSSLAADGSEALTHFRADPASYCLVMLDYKLPGMDAGEIFRELRATRADIRIVLMSGYTLEDALQRSPEMHFAGFLKKPFTLDSLAEGLRSALET